MKSFDVPQLLDPLYPFDDFLAAAKQAKLEACRFGIIRLPSGNRQRAVSVLPYVYDTSKGMWDIDHWLTKFCDGLRITVSDLLAENITPIITLIDYDSWDKAHFPQHPWNPKNNIQHIGGKTITESHWTGPDNQHESLYMEQFWWPLAINLKRVLGPLMSKVIIEIASSPAQSWDAIDWMVWQLVEKQKFIQKNQCWLSMRGNMISKYVDYVNPKDHTENYPLKRSVDTISIQANATKQDAAKVIPGLKKKYPSINWRPDTYDAQGMKWLKNIPVIDPNLIKSLATIYGGIGVAGHPNDAMQSITKWVETWKQAAQVLGALKK